MADGRDREAGIARIIESYNGEKTREQAEKIYEDSVKAGTCSFCGYGDGWLGEQGDEMTQYMPGIQRVGEPGAWTYEPHPNAYGERGNTRVTWCGNCVSGLAFKYQRLDDGNLRAKLIGTKVRLSLDAPKWDFWDVNGDERAKLIAAGRWPDDQSIHLEKLWATRDVEDMQNEVFRRAGFDLTTRGWRP